MPANRLSWARRGRAAACVLAASAAGVLAACGSAVPSGGSDQPTPTSSAARRRLRGLGLPAGADGRTAGPAARSRCCSAATSRTSAAAPCSSCSIRCHGPMVDLAAGRRMERPADVRGARAGAELRPGRQRRHAFERRRDGDPSAGRLIHRPTPRSRRTSPACARRPGRRQIPRRHRSTNDYQPNYARGHNYWQTFQYRDGSLASTGCAPQPQGAPAPTQLLTGSCPAA